MDAENISTGNEWFLASPALLNKSDMKLSQGSFYFEEGRNRREEAQMGEAENLLGIPGLPSGLNPLLMGLCSG